MTKTVTLSKLYEPSTGDIVFSPKSLHFQWKLLTVKTENTEETFSYLRLSSITHKTKQLPLQHRFHHFLS